MISIHALAQIAVENQALFTYGPLGVICAYFMWRDGKKDSAHEAERTAFINEIRGLNHRLDGLTKAFLVDMMERDKVSPHSKDFAREAIAKIDARSKQEVDS